MATKKPTGLKAKRAGDKLTCEWKIADSDYGDGQQFEFRVKDATHTGYWTVKNVGNKATSKVVTRREIAVSAMSTLPSGQVYTLNTLREVQFRVKGNRKKYKKNGKTVTPGWSDWASMSYVFDVPNVPTIKEEWNSSLVNQTTFSWEVSISNDDNKPFYATEWQSTLVKDCNTTDGRKIDFNSSSAVVDTSGSSTYRSGTGTDSGNQTFTEDTTLLADGSYTRWFRVRSYGWAGFSDWSYSYHTYSATKRAEVGGAEAVVSATGNGYEVVIDWTADSSSANPIDSVTVQYAIVNPTVTATQTRVKPVSGSDYVSSEYELSLGVPAGTSWSDATIVADTSGTDKIRFEVDTVLNKDQVLFARVNTHHDSGVTHGKPILVYTENLSEPTLTSVVTNDTTYRATVTAQNNSAVNGSFMAVYFFSDSYRDGLMVGVIPSGSTSVTVQCPNWSADSHISFSVKAVVGVYSYASKSSGQRVFSLYSSLLQSGSVSQGGDVPQAPTSVVVSPTAIPGTVRVTWNWPWAEADGAELSWSDHEDAWESTDDPETYTLTNLQPAHWNIAGLETGVTWYVRVRLLKGSGDNIIYGAWSSLDSTSIINLSSAPSKPVLVVSDGVITEDGNVTCSWVYSTTDGTSQAYAEIAEVTISGEGNTYTPIAHTETSQHLTINAKAAGWEAGNIYNLSVRVVSASGRVSDEWSDYVPVTVADPLVCTISEVGFVTKTIPLDDGSSRTVLALTELPFTVTVLGAGDGGTTTVVVERAEDYRINRPDESTFNGFKGETIILKSQVGENQMEFTDVDLIGKLDDGAAYTLTAIVQDGLGQISEASIEFEVHWNHKAAMPKGKVIVDNESMIAKITPSMDPIAYSDGDTIDIYRLSADRPELIYQGAEFGTTYVDPYPAIGEFGGYRLVYKTYNGDYITEDGIIAWLDLNDYLQLDYNINIIDFAGEQIQFYYNTDYSNNWEKSFESTEYLGGAIQGDWGSTVKRTGNLSSLVITTLDQDMIQSLRRLADYNGICHVRTADGSSYSANIDVSEDRNHTDMEMRSSYSLSITKVDPEGYDGMTLSQWKYLGR